MKIEANMRYLSEKLSNSKGSDFRATNDFPAYLHIETFMGCNARCIMCGIDEWKRERALMRDEVFSKIADEVIKHHDKIERVSMHLGGEPLLDKQLALRIKKLKDGGVRNVFFTTNASLLSKEKAIEILESGVDQIDISFHSIEKDKYETIMKGLKFDDVLENILQLVSIRDALGFNTKIRIRSVEMLCNKSESDRFISFWKSKINFDFGDAAYAKNVNNRFVSEKNKIDNSELIGSDDFDFVDVNLLPCYPLWNSMFILSDGRVALCCVDMGKNIILGDTRHQTLKEIWKSQVLQDFREKHLSFGRGSCSLCKNCNVWL